jgi:hypothetical protein
MPFFCKGQVSIADPVEAMLKSGTEGAVVDRATNLEQQIGALLWPSHLQGLVHAPVDQKVCCAIASVIDVPTRRPARCRLP